MTPSYRALLTHWAPVPLRLIVGYGFVVHWQFGFSSIKFLAVTADGPQFGKPGVETDLLYVALALVAGGVGPLAVGGWRKAAAARGRR